MWTVRLSLNDLVPLQLAASDLISTAIWLVSLTLPSSSSSTLDEELEEDPDVSVIILQRCDGRRQPLIQRFYPRRSN